MQSTRDIFKDKKKIKEILDKHKYVTREFQDYGYRLAVKLGDVKHVSLYIKLAKERNRTLLEQALSFTVDYPNAKSKPKLFMWKLKQLQDEYDKKRSETKH